MTISKEKDPRAILRRLTLALDEELPDETPALTAARLGVDVDALAAHVRGRLDAIDAERRDSRPPARGGTPPMGMLIDLQRQADPDGEPGS